MLHILSFQKEKDEFSHSEPLWPIRSDGRAVAGHGRTYRSVQQLLDVIIQCSAGYFGGSFEQQFKHYHQ